MISSYENSGKIYKIDVTDDIPCEIYRKGKLVYSDRYGSVISSARSYQNGFRDGMSLNGKHPQTITFMGLGLEKLAEIVTKYLDEEFYAEKQWTPEQMENLKTRQSKINKEKESKMTREEALNILIKRQEFDASTLKVRTSETERKELAKNELETLEALGLIKFDEPPKRKYIFFPHPDAGKDNVSVYKDDAIKTFKEYGYTVGKEVDLVPYKTPDDAAFIMELKQQGYIIIKEDNPK